MGGIPHSGEVQGNTYLSCVLRLCAETVLRELARQVIKRKLMAAKFTFEVAAVHCLDDVRLSGCSLSAMICCLASVIGGR